MGKKFDKVDDDKKKVNKKVDFFLEGLTELVPLSCSQECWRMQDRSEELPFPLSDEGDAHVYDDGTDGTPHFVPSVIVADKRGIICSINEPACLLFGYPRHELLGRNVKILMPPAVAEQHDSILQRYFERGKFKGTTTRVVFGVTKTGQTVKLRLSFSSIIHGSSHLISALIDKVDDKSFSVTTDGKGRILSVEGNVEETCGYKVQQLVGENVSCLCPLHIALEHGGLMSCYVMRRSSRSTVVGQVRNRELKHALGHIIPVALEVREERAGFYATVTEIDKTVEAMIIVDQSRTIISVSPACSVLFGYEESEMIGMSVSRLAPRISLREGKCVVVCQHKDGSHIFVSADIEAFFKDGEECFRGLLKRVRQNRFGRQLSQIQYSETISSDNVLDWYDVTSKVLGQGFFGTVKVGRHRLSGVLVAIKTLKRQQYLDNGIKYPPREIEIISKLTHPNIYRFFHAISTEEAVYFISEMVSGGELFDYAVQHVRLPESGCRAITRQILCAVAYMHSQGVCHRDLKLENILIDASGQIKIIDFGLGNFFALNSTLSTFCGSPDYAPPELWASQPYYGPSVDVWAIGVILYILVSGFVPFDNSTNITDIQYLWPNGVPVSQELHDLIDRIFQPESLRATVDDLIHHKWMNDCGVLQPVQVAVQTKVVVLNEGILMDMEDRLGLRVDDVRSAVLSGEHNQLTTTYALLEFQFQERLQNRRASDLSPPGSARRGSYSPLEMPESPKSQSPVSGSGSRKGSLRDSLRNSQNAKCSIM